MNGVYFKFMKKCCFGFLVVLALVVAIVAFAGPSIYSMAMKFIYPQNYSEIVKLEAEKYGLDENLVYAVIKTESGFDKDAVSHADAKGLMQLTEETFEWILTKDEIAIENPNIFSPEDNIHAGCALLRLLLDYYGSLDVALSAYNAGMGNVSSWLSKEEFSHNGKELHTIPFPETESYVKKGGKNLEIYNEIY